MKYSCRIIFTLFTVACAVALLNVTPKEGWGWNLSALIGLAGLVIGAPISFWIGKKFDDSWWDN